MVKIYTNRYFSLALSLFFGATLCLAFAPYNIFPLAIICPAALLYLIQHHSAKQSFYLGLMFGLGLFGFGVHWIYTSIHDIGEVPPVFATFITMSLITALALFPALTAYLATRYFARNPKTLCLYAFPSIWLLSELLRGSGLIGFPWFILGYSQTESLLKHFAPLFGVYGISCILIFSSGLLTYSFMYCKSKRIVINLSVLIAFWLIGGLLSFVTWTTPQTTSLKVALVQGNIPQSIKWSPEHVELSLNRYSDMTERLWGKYDLIVWPEAAIPLPKHIAQNYLNELNQQALRTNTTLLVGVPIADQTGRSYYNALINVSDHNQTYAKKRLVPFGEYVPFSNLIQNALQFMDIPMSNMVAGANQQHLLQVKNIKVLPSICYEVGFTDLTFSNDASLGFLLTVTNDAWFGHSNAQVEHLQMGKMRALELSRPLLFLGNDGITAIIHANGTVAASAPQYVTTVLTGEITPRLGKTPWMYFKSYPLYILLFYLFLKAYRKHNYFADPLTQKKVN